MRQEMALRVEVKVMEALGLTPEWCGHGRKPAQKDQLPAFVDAAGLAEIVSTARRDCPAWEAPSATRASHLGIWQRGNNAGTRVCGRMSTG
jgi:hypothetical protein